MGGEAPTFSDRLPGRRGPFRTPKTDEISTDFLKIKNSGPLGIRTGPMVRTRRCWAEPRRLHGCGPVRHKPSGYFKVLSSASPIIKLAAPPGQGRHWPKTLDSQKNEPELPPDPLGLPRTPLGVGGGKARACAAKSSRGTIEHP